MDSNAKVTFYIKVILLLILLGIIMFVTRAASGLHSSGAASFTALPM